MKLFPLQQIAFHETKIEIYDHQNTAGIDIIYDKKILQIIWKKEMNEIL